MTEPAPEKPVLEKPVLEQAVSEHDHLLRLAASDLGQAYKSLAAGELAIRPVTSCWTSAAVPARICLPFFASVTLYILTAGAD